MTAVWRVEETDRRIIVYFNTISPSLNPFDQPTSRSMKEICTRASASGKRLVLDFGSVDVISSGIIGLLVLLNRTAKTDQVDVRIANVRGSVLEVFRITRLHTVFRHDDDGDRP